MLRQGDQVERRLCLPDGTGGYEFVWVRAGHYSGPYPGGPADTVLVYHGSIGGFVGPRGAIVAAPAPKQLVHAVATPSVSVIHIDDVRLYAPRR